MGIGESVEAKRDLRKIDRRTIAFYLLVFDGTERQILGHLLDISEKGLQIWGENEIVVDRPYFLSMRLPALMKKDRDEIFFSATSRWCRHDRISETYLTGFQIENLRSTTRKIISALIRDFGYSRQDSASARS
ncbi:MAG: PilZ domain-containing protein [Desulforhopalus sp.]